MLETRTIKRSIASTPRQVTEDLADPGNHPLWATEFFAGPGEFVGAGIWRMKVPAMGGDVQMKVDSDIEAGIVDLYLAPAGRDFDAALPVRVIPNGVGADVLFTLARMPGQTEEAFEQGVESMERELDQLKSRLEGAR